MIFRAFCFLKKIKTGEINIEDCSNEVLLDHTAWMTGMFILKLFLFYINKNFHLQIPVLVL